jgi:hypothetical protein
MTAALYAIALSPWGVFAAYAVILPAILWLDVRRHRRAQGGVRR